MIFWKQTVNTTRTGNRCGKRFRDTCTTILTRRTDLAGRPFVQVCAPTARRARLDTRTIAVNVDDTSAFMARSPSVLIRWKNKIKRPVITRTPFIVPAGRLHGFRFTVSTDHENRVLRWVECGRLKVKRNQSVETTCTRITPEINDTVT